MQATFTGGLLSLSNTVIPFGANLLVHSTIIIAIGLFGKHLLRKKGAAIQSMFLRACLIAVLFTPLTSLIFSSRGIKIYVPALPLNKKEAGYSTTRPYQNQLPVKIPEKLQHDVQSATAIPEQEDKSTIPRPEKATPDIHLEVDKTTPVSDETEQDYSAALPPEEKIASVIHQVTTKGTSAFSPNIYAGFYIVFTVTWIAFSLFFLMRAVVVYFYLRHVNRSSIDAKPPYTKTCNTIANEMGIAAPRVLQNPGVKCTFLAGFLHPSIVLPAGEHETAMTSREVFIHELAHLARRDYFWNWLCQIVKIILPLQPLLWILARQIEEASDYVCDDYVVNYGNNSRLYAVQLHTMIQSLQPRITEMDSGVGILSAKTPLRRRIERIVAGSSPRHITAKLHEIVSVIILFCFSIILTGFIRFKNNGFKLKSENNESQDHIVADTSSGKEDIMESDFADLTEVEDTSDTKKELSTQTTVEIDTDENQIEKSESIFEDTLAFTEQIPLEIERVTFEQSSETRPTGSDTEPRDTGLIASAEGVTTEEIHFTESQVSEEHSVDHPSDTISGKEAASPTENEKVVNEAQTEEPGIITEQKTEVSTGSLFNVSNAGMKLAGFRDNKIKMPVAKAVNVTVNFDYENYEFDLRNEEERRQYNIYRGLDKLKNEPAWSPDGKWIAFTDRNRIWIVSPEGGEPRLIYESFHDGFSVGNFESLCFTPDSREITFKKDIYDTNRGSTVEIHENYDNSGRYAFFSNPIPNIESVNIYTGEHRIIVKDGYRCCWSKNGRYLCYLNFDSRVNSETEKPEKFGLPAVYDTKTGKTWFLSDDETVGYSRPTFSPDNSNIVIPIRQFGGPTVLFRIPLQGGKPKQLTIYDEETGKCKYFYYPEYSPDGKWILYTDYTMSSEHTDKRLFVYSTVTGEQFEYFQNAETRNSLGKWSPDGTKICYIVEKESANYIYICDFYPDNYELQKPFLEENTTPLSFKLYANYPNPFNLKTTIEFSLPESGYVSLVIFNIMGQKVRKLVSENMIPGTHSVVWDGRDENGSEIASGVYVSQLRMGNRITNVKMTLMK